MTDPWPLPRKHLSASALASFAECPEKFRRTYVNDEWGPPFSAGVVGSGVHGGVEYALNHRIIAGRLPTRQAARDAYHHAFENELRLAGGSEEVDWSSETRGSAELRGEQLFLAYFDEVLPGVEPLSSEHKFRIEVAGVPVPIIGKVDYVEATRKVDVKSSGSSVKTMKPGWSIQALIYLLVDGRPMEYHTLVRLAGGVVVRTPRWTSEGAPKGKDDAPDGANPGLAMPRTADNHAAAGALVRSYANGIRAYWEAFGPDEPWPGARVHTFACGYCEFRDRDCPYWRAPADPLLTAGVEPVDTVPAT